MRDTATIDCLNTIYPSLPARTPPLLTVCASSSPRRQAKVEHPVVVTEAPCNPLHCRQMMSELLFECYQVPHVSYGVDALYSFNANGAQQGAPGPRTGVVLSSGYHCSHVLPVINGR